MSLHITTGNPLRSLAPARQLIDGAEVTYARSSTVMLLNSAHYLNDLLLSGILARFPELWFVLVESGIGWIPFCLEACDHHFVAGDARRAAPRWTCSPASTFHRQVSACYWFESAGPARLLELIGTANVMFETDSPH